MGTFKTFAIYAGAVICFGGLIFAGIRMMSGRFHLTATAQEFQFRNGDFATVERIGEDRSLTVRNDQGRSIALSEEQSRNIDYGYATERMPSRGVDRVIVSGDASHVGAMQKDFARLSGQIHDLAIYTSGTPGQSQEVAIVGGQYSSSPLKVAGNISDMAPEIVIEGYGLGR